MGGRPTGGLDSGDQDDQDNIDHGYWNYISVVIIHMVLLYILDLEDTSMSIKNYGLPIKLKVE